MIAQTMSEPAQAGEPLASLGSDRLICIAGDPALLADAIAPAPAAPQRLSLDPDKVERGLSQLVLTVIELLRRLVERQALRRVEHGTLDDAAIERMGLALMRLEERMEELKTIFDLSDEDLNLDLGPLGRLM